MTVAQEGGNFVYLVQRILISLCIQKTHVVHSFLICQPSGKLCALPIIREVDLFAIANDATIVDDDDTVRTRVGTYIPFRSEKGGEFGTLSAAARCLNSLKHLQLCTPNTLGVKSLEKSMSS